MLKLLCLFLKKKVEFSRKKSSSSVIWFRENVGRLQMLKVKKKKNVGKSFLEQETRSSRVFACFLIHCSTARLEVGLTRIRLSGFDWYSSGVARM